MLCLWCIVVAKSFSVRLIVQRLAFEWAKTSAKPQVTRSVAYLCGLEENRQRQRKVNSKNYDEWTTSDFI